MTNAPRPEAPLGTLRPDGGLHYVRRLPHAPEKVWRALTESEHLVHWFPADIVGERRPGAPLKLPFWPAQVERYGIAVPVIDGEMLAWDPPRLFELTWDTDRLRWELEPDGDGTLLTFTTWLHDTSPAAVTNAGAGYHVCLDQLRELMDTGAVTYLEDGVVRELEKRYAGLGRPAD